MVVVTASHCMHACCMHTCTHRGRRRTRAQLHWCRHRCSEVLAARKHLLAGRAQDDSVLVLGRVRPLHVRQGWTGAHQTHVHKVAQGSQVPRLTPLGAIDHRRAAIRALQPAAAEGQRAERLVDVRQQLARAGSAQRHVRRVRVAGVVGALHVLHNEAAAGGTKRLDREHLALLHLGVVGALHDGHALAAVDPVRRNGVAVEIPDALDLVCLAIQLDLVALHHLLDCFADVTQTHVNASGLDARVGRLLDCLQQRVILGVEGNSEGAVDDAAINLGAEIDLHDIVVLQGREIAIVGRVVSSHVVEGDAGGEADARLQAVLLHQPAVHLLQALAEVDQPHAWLDDALRVRPHLAVHLRGQAQRLVCLLACAIQRALLGVSGAEAVEVARVILDLALGQLLASEQVGHRDAGRLRLTIGNIVIRLSGHTTERRVLGRHFSRATRTGTGTTRAALLLLALALLLLAPLTIPTLLSFLALISLFRCCLFSLRLFHTVALGLSRLVACGRLALLLAALLLPGARRAGRCRLSSLGRFFLVSHRCLSRSRGRILQLNVLLLAFCLHVVARSV
mmetsp:Transcript_16786/g.53694  ORF Transcript_16786/g.53694 Transcript_16786/m.53694 type:complete len:566 (+) Transcript_16786:740-2437(+)